jgi:hypothetical protein
LRPSVEGFNVSRDPVRFGPVKNLFYGCCRPQDPYMVIQVGVPYEGRDERDLIIVRQSFKVKPDKKFGNVSKNET